MTDIELLTQAVSRMAATIIESTIPIILITIDEQQTATPTVSFAQKYLKRNKRRKMKIYARRNFSSRSINTLVGSRHRGDVVLEKEKIKYRIF